LRPALDDNGCFDAESRPGRMRGGVDSGRKAGADAAIGQGDLQIPREMNTIDRGLRRL
jgi:hypothetical protein